MIAPANELMDRRRLTAGEALLLTLEHYRIAAIIPTEAADHRLGHTMTKRANGAAAKTVLVVEDHDLNMKLFSDLLETRGHRVLQARDGTEGLQLARQHRPDLILMDIQLPEISGFEVTKWIRAEEGLRYIPIIAVTAFAMKGDEEEIREAGCDAYISKPVSVRNFLELIDRFLV